MLYDPTRCIEKEPTADLMSTLCLQGMRASLPSASIMLRQPMQRFAQMQASDIDIYRNEIRKVGDEIVSLQLTAMLQVAHSGWLKCLVHCLCEVNAITQ